MLALTGMNMLLMLYFMGQDVGAERTDVSMCIWQGLRLEEWFLGSGRRYYMM